MKFIKICIVAAAVFSGPVFGQERLRIAVLDLQAGEGVKQSVANTVTDLLTGSFVNTGLFRVTERSNIRAVLKEQSVQTSGLYANTNEAIKIGQLLSADKIAVGRVSRLNEKIFINVRIIDVTKGEVEFAAKGQANRVDDLDAGVNEVTDRIARRIGGSSYKSKDTASRSGYLDRGAFVPGYRQIQNGRSWQGYSFAGGFAVGLAGYLGAKSSHESAISEYNDSTYPFMTILAAPDSALLLNAMHFQSKRAQVQSTASQGNAALALLGAVYAWSYVDAVYFNKRSAFKHEKQRSERPVDFAFSAVPESDLNGKRSASFAFAFKGKF